MSKILTKSFFACSPLVVARGLLGKVLLRRYRGRIIKGIITEAEAYAGENDPGSHAYRGRTLRTEVMFGEPGTVYVYLIYGMYSCLNIVTGKKGEASAVLIRGIELLDGRKLDGPGKLCREMRIDKRLNKEKLRRGRLWIRDEGIAVALSDIERTARIGISNGKDRMWRFVLRESPHPG